MKGIIWISVILTMILAIAAVSGGDTNNAEVVDWQPSEIYSDEDINAAINTVKAYFRLEFKGCTLTQITYAGDGFCDAFEHWANRYNADQAIILISSFDVDSSGSDGSLRPNSTYNNWQWVLVRNKNGVWKHVDHGYG